VDQMNDFLKLEYEQCMGLVKYYDERHHALMKYAVSISSGVPTMLLGIYGLGANITPVFWNAAAVICLIITMLGLVSILAAITQTRLYFVYPARQLNAIRAEFLRTVAQSFTDNQMYLDTTFNAFKLYSSHTVQQAMVALQVGLFAGLFVFALNVTTLPSATNICIGTNVAISVAVAAFLTSARYLHKKSSLHPDKAVHQKEG